MVAVMELVDAVLLSPLTLRHLGSGVASPITPARALSWWLVSSPTLHTHAQAPLDMVPLYLAYPCVCPTL